MIDQISKILVRFEKCFSRKAAFYWFVIVVFGFLIRIDHDGVSSIVRWIGLNPNYYTTLLNFFRATSWSLARVQACWRTIVLDFCSVVSINNYAVLVGDGIKIPKEAHKMPGVKKLHQESNNSAKPTFIFGHHFGVLSLLVGSVGKIFAIPLCAWIQEGIVEFTGKSDHDAHPNLLSSMTSRAIQMVSLFKDKGCLLVLDAFYAVGPCFLDLTNQCDKSGRRLLHLITRAKSNVVAYRDPAPRSGKQGRPPKYGQKVKLTQLFATCRAQFQRVSLDLYGKKTEIAYLCLDLLWKPIKDKVRFVLVIDQDKHFILMCSDLCLTPNDIITAYSYRFKIEVSFNVMKNLIGSFCYHFWTAVWPKLCRTHKVSVQLPKDARSQRLIKEAIAAIEGYANFGCIATGILQILALCFPKQIWRSYRGWLRTISSKTPSEETVRSVVQEEFYHNFPNFNSSLIYRIITDKSRKDYFDIDDSAA